MAGKTGEVVYVGNVSSYDGDKAALAGKVLLCDSSNSRNFTFAQEVGAISVMTTASLDNYSNPIESDPWFGPEGAAADWYDEWYGGGERVVHQLRPLRRRRRFQQEPGRHGRRRAHHRVEHLPDQYNALRTLLDDGYTVEMNVASVGEMYEMSGDHDGAQGQLTAIAEIKGADPELQKERVVLAAHVQEPGCDDNATGVALNLELAVKMKQMIDAGIIERPARTIVFMWGDEMSFSDLYLDAHAQEWDNIICCIDLDMVGRGPGQDRRPHAHREGPRPLRLL